MDNSRWNERDLAMMVGGLALGLVASRLVPLMASARGSLSARQGGDPFQRLIDDHRTILATLRDMEQTTSGSTLRRSAMFLTLKRTLGKHALAEEDVVYPLLHAEAGERENTKHLYDEHADMKIHLYEIEQRLKAGEDWSDHVRPLAELIREHIRDEEEVEFPKLRAVLDEQRARRVSGLIHREEAMVL